MTPSDAAAERHALSARADDAIAALQQSISGLNVATAQDRELVGDVPRWGDERFQQQLRDGAGGDAARRLQAEVDAGRTDWDELRGDVPRYADLQREWGAGATAAMRGEDPAGVGVAGGPTDADGDADERDAWAWLRSRSDDTGYGSGSR